MDSAPRVVRTAVLGTLKVVRALVEWNASMKSRVVLSALASFISTTACESVLNLGRRRLIAADAVDLLNGDGSSPEDVPFALIILRNLGSSLVVCV